MNDETQKLGTLYIVATPIGNLSDITLRAIEILKAVDIVVCEDTRVSKKLLDHLGIEKKMMSLHQHSGDDKINIVICALERGLDIAYITDGGTPGISDPGQELVANIRNQISNIKIIPIPGASAVASVISISGMVEKEFYFAGFLPKKKGRQTKLKMLLTLGCPVIIYESAMRIEKTLKDVLEYFGENTEVFIAREMTKMFEEYWGGKIVKVISDLKKHTLKGEIVLIIKKSKIKDRNNN